MRKAFQSVLTKVEEEGFLNSKALEFGFKLCWEMFAEPALSAVASDPWTELYADNLDLIRAAGMLQPFHGAIWDGDELGDEDFEYPSEEPERSAAIRQLLGDWDVSSEGGDHGYLFFSTYGLDDQKPYNKSASLEVGHAVYGKAMVSTYWDGVSND